MAIYYSGLTKRQTLLHVLSIHKLFKFYLQVCEVVEDTQIKSNGPKTSKSNIFRAFLNLFYFHMFFFEFLKPLFFMYPGFFELWLLHFKR